MWQYIVKKKLCISAFCLIFIIIISYLPYRINDFSCSVYRNKIEDSLANISEVNVLQVVSGCGNSSGTGNHTDLYVAVLVETSLFEEDLKNKITNVSWIHNVEQDGNSTLAMEIIGLNFNEAKFNSNLNYYILEFAKASPFSAFDMRGH